MADASGRSPNLEPDAERLLKRIAAALDKPETAFLDGSEDTADLAGATELLRIWSSLKSDADRRKVLAFARSVAEGRTR